MERPDPRAFRDNWRRSPLPTWKKLALVVRNNALKAKNRSACCGNHGQPGC